MTIIINSPNELIADGENLGAVFDAIANHPQLPKADVQRAFLDYIARIEAGYRAAAAEEQARAAADKAAALETLTARANAEIEKANNALAAEKTARDEAIATRDAIATQSTALREDVAKLGNAQRDAIEVALTALQTVRAINTHALADDDARKLAQQQAERAARAEKLREELQQLAS